MFPAIFDSKICRWATRQIPLESAALFSRADDGKAPLLVLREDAGNLLGTMGYAPNSALNEDISLTMACLDDWMAKIRKATTVITDRLHVGVAAVLLGKQRVYIDPYGSL